MKQDETTRPWYTIDELNEWADKYQNQEWRNAAIRLGEELASVGPDGYYNMEAKDWLDWAMANVKSQIEFAPVKMVAYNCTCGKTMKFESERGIVAPQRTWVGLNWLPEHKCGLHLSHNEHRDVYETVEQFYDADDFISTEEWDKAVAEDSVWVLHWYPNTPIGFTRIAASTLDAIEAKLKEKNT
jgi:hypothetical protein